MTQATVVLVTSAIRGEGRTSIVVNLAACLAETGRRVLVLDSDFRSPSTHIYFNLSDGRGLSDLLATQLATDLDHLATPTQIAGVRLVTSGTSVDQPAALLSRMAALLSEARRLADVVLLDSPPVLESNDAIDLLPHVDAILLVARTGVTTVTQAERTADVLSRVDATPIGIALVDSVPHRRSGNVNRRRTFDNFEEAPQTNNRKGVDSNGISVNGVPSSTLAAGRRNRLRSARMLRRQDGGS